MTLSWIQLVEIYQHTKQYAQEHFPVITESRKHKISEFAGPYDPLAPTNDVADVYVVNEDMIDTYVKLKEQGYNPVLLNLASDTTPGGGVERGCYSQEECIFRRSNYFMTLTRDFYPIKKLESIYSKDVTLFKDAKHNLMETPIKMDIIACPSVKCPDLVDGLFKHEDEYVQEQKIRLIFLTAIRHRHDSIVLGAFGCGAYNCPPKQVAEMFKRAVEKYKNHFKVIVFAILRKPYDKRDNFKIFNDVLK